MQSEDKKYTSGEKRKESEILRIIFLPIDLAELVASNS